MQPTTTNQPVAPANRAELDLDTINQELSESEAHPLESIPGWNLLSLADRERIISFAEVVIDSTLAKAGDPERAKRQADQAERVASMDRKYKQAQAIRQRARETMVKLVDAVQRAGDKETVKLCDSVILLGMVRWGDDIDQKEPNCVKWIIAEAEELIGNLDKQPR